ncbi:MAG: isoprenylcysteine carboxylmethyltransferase family protein, partial [Burkholderia contaminans]
MNSTLDGIAAVQDRPPRSATPLRAGLLGITAGLFALWITRDQPTLDAATRAVIASLAIIGTIALHEIFISRVYLRPSAGLSRQAVRPLGIARVATRLGALTSIYAGIGVIYWLLPEYHGRFYLPFWSLLRSLAPYVIVAAPFYFAWMDRHQRETDDAYLLWGRFLFRRERPASWKPVREMLAGWGVKAFFLPLMTVYLSKDADHLTASLANAMHAPMTIATFVFMYDLSFTMDLMFGTVGYLCTFRILDSHVRTVEPTTLGWVAALMCYQPFWSLFSNNYIRYEGSMFWDNWLMSAPTLRVIWGSVIILLLLTYALCTISFGLRFSNLTNRGIITSGPYRFTKHPAYITKNLSYWMVSVPFVEPLGWQVGLMHCAGLVAINLIYYTRAKTEERHLMRDPDYRAYAEWIEQHG